MKYLFSLCLILVGCAQDNGSGTVSLHPINGTWAKASGNCPTSSLQILGNTFTVSANAFPTTYYYTQYGSCSPTGAVQLITVDSFTVKAGNVVCSNQTFPQNGTFWTTDVTLSVSGSTLTATDGTCTQTYSKQ